MSLLTCSHHFIDGDAGGVQLLGELVHGLARVLVRVRVHVGLDARQTHCSREKQFVTATTIQKPDQTHAHRYKGHTKHLKYVPNEAFTTIQSF